MVMGNKGNDDGLFYQFRDLLVLYKLHLFNKIINDYCSFVFNMDNFIIRNMLIRQPITLFVTITD